MLGEVDAVILSDYGKGGLTHIVRMISLARRAGKPVLVDPKGDDYSRYRGATLITPNRSEFRQVAGAWKDERDLTERAQRLRSRLDAKALLVTRGGEGMTLFQDGSRLHVATQAREVSDVSGAGDTVIATLAVALASGARMKDAVRLANRAAGIVVGKFGTAVVTPKELFGK
jgi:rfaE bifunctional protein kinase chain/domain